MPTRLRKVRRLRGSRTHGWGQIGQHRKTGAKGGRGMAGGHKHKWTKLLKTDYFGEHGFTPVRVAAKKTVNLFQVSEYALKSGSDIVNLHQLGVSKLLGGGKLLKPLTVVVEEWSKKAAEKIEGVGGKVVKPEEVKSA
ncbi:MAG: uL15 family ribosomal protein [Candidatus Caldarchaeum sp.]